MGLWSPAVTDMTAVQRASREGAARTAVAAHAELTRDEQVEPGDIASAHVSHLLCDLMHLSLDLGADFTRLMTHAERLFLEDRLLS